MADEESIVVHCPHCRNRFRGKATLIGKSGPCPTCKQAFTITQDLIVKSAAAQESAETDGTRRPAVLQPGNLTTFSSSSYGYRFSLPTEGWHRYSRTDEGAVDADIFVEHPAIGAIKILVSEWQHDFESLHEGIEDAYRSEVRDFNLISRTQTTIDSYPASAIEYEGVEPANNEKLKFLSHVILKNGFAYQIIGMARPVLFPRLKKDVLVAIASFSFSGEPAAEPRKAAEVPAEAMIGNWKRQGQWYLGHVVRRDGQRVLVRYIDGDEEWCEPDQVQKPVIVPGLRVLAKRAESDVWHPGIVQEVQSDAVRVAFFHSDEESISGARVRFDDLGTGDLIAAPDQSGKQVRARVVARRQDVILCEVEGMGQVEVGTTYVALIEKSLPSGVAVSAQPQDRGSGRRTETAPVEPKVPPVPQNVLLPKATFVAVPVFAVLGFLVLREYFASLKGSFIGWIPGFLWWAVWPLFGYYLALGWEASGLPACKALREWATEIAIKLTNGMIMLGAAVNEIIINVLTDGRAKGFAVNLGRLTCKLNAVCYRALDAALGRLLSAAVIGPLPLLVQISKKKHSGIGWAILMHVLGGVPFLVFLGLLCWPAAQQANPYTKPVVQPGAREQIHMNVPQPQKPAVTAREVATRPAVAPLSSEAPAASVAPTPLAAEAPPVQASPRVAGNVAAGKPKGEWQKYVEQNLRLLGISEDAEATVALIRDSKRRATLSVKVGEAVVLNGCSVTVNEISKDGVVLTDGESTMRVHSGMGRTR